MTRNRQPFPESLPEFVRMFPDEETCGQYLYDLRWPDGFECRYCGWRGEPFRFANKWTIFRCRNCEKDTSLTADTIMHGTHTPLTTWFWAAYLVTTQTPGMSALQFQKQLDIGRYETAFQMLHKLRAAMVRPDRDRIGGEWPVEVDETYVGGETKGKGRGVTDKVLVVAAVEARERDDQSAKRRRTIYAGRLRMRHVPNRDGATLRAFVLEAVQPRTTVVTDGYPGYDKLSSDGYRHIAETLGHDPAKVEATLPLIHLVFSNLKAWLQGTHHGVSEKHLQAYLNEYVFRFNRRFYPMTAFNSVLGIGATAREHPTYEGIYEGTWLHPNPADGSERLYGSG